MLERLTGDDEIHRVAWNFGPVVGVVDLDVDVDAGCDVEPAVVPSVGIEEAFVRQALVAHDLRAEVEDLERLIPVRGQVDTDECVHLLVRRVMHELRRYRPGHLLKIF